MLSINFFFRDLTFLFKRRNYSPDNSAHLLLDRAVTGPFDVRYVRNLRDFGFLTLVPGITLTGITFRGPQSMSWLQRWPLEVGLSLEVKAPSSDPPYQLVQQDQGTSGNSPPPSGQTVISMEESWVIMTRDKNQPIPGQWHTSLGPSQLWSSFQASYLSKVTKIYIVYALIEIIFSSIIPFNYA